MIYVIHANNIVWNVKIGSDVQNVMLVGILMEVHVWEFLIIVINLTQWGKYALFVDMVITLLKVFVCNAQ